MLRPRHLIALLLICACVSETARLQRQLASSDPELRAAAAKRLGALRDRNAVPLLIPLLKDSSPLVRFEAGVALGNIRDPQALEPLYAALQTEEREDLAVAFTSALGELGSVALDHLVQLTLSPRARVRMTACQALGRIGARRAVEPLIRRLDDPDYQVRRAAIAALRRIGDPRGLDAIIRKLSGPDRATEAAAEQALSGAGYEENLQEIRRVLRTVRR